MRTRAVVAAGVVAAGVVSVALAVGIRPGPLQLVPKRASLAPAPGSGAARRPGAVDGAGIRTFTFTYAAQVDTLPAGARSVALWLPYPESDAYQDVVVTAVQAPVTPRLTRDPLYGNAILFVSLPRPSTGALTVSLEVRVTRRERLTRPWSTDGRLSPSVAPPPRRFLEPDRLVPLDRRIRALAADVTRGRTTDLDKVRAIYDYVVSTMRYDKSGTGWGRGDLYWACDTRRGNCTDFHALFIGLCRAVGIAAKFVIGFPLPPDRERGDIEGYHCWAEFFLPGYGWVPVDTSEASRRPAQRTYFFGALDVHRVQFAVGRDVPLDPPQAGLPLNYFIYPYVEVDGRPFTQVRTRFRFQDLDASSESGR